LLLTVCSRSRLEAPRAAARARPSGGSATGDRRRKDRLRGSSSGSRETMRAPAMALVAPPLGYPVPCGRDCRSRAQTVAMERRTGGAAGERSEAVVGRCLPKPVRCSSPFTISVIHARSNGREKNSDVAQSLLDFPARIRLIEMAQSNSSQMGCVDSDLYCAIPPDRIWAPINCSLVTTPLML